MIYEPAEDSYLLEKYVKKLASGKVLDLGCGSGIQSEAALKKSKEVLAADISQEAVDYCRKKGINAIISNLFSSIKGKFDLIIFNPPYLPKDNSKNQDTARIVSGGKKGSEILSKFLRDAKKHLEKDGKILLVCSSLTGDVESLFREYSYKFKKLDEQSFFFEKIYVFLLSL